MSGRAAVCHTDGACVLSERREGGKKKELPSNFLSKWNFYKKTQLKSQHSLCLYVFGKFVRRCHGYETKILAAAWKTAGKRLLVNMLSKLRFSRRCVLVLFRNGGNMWTLTALLEIWPRSDVVYVSTEKQTDKELKLANARQNVNTARLCQLFTAALRPDCVLQSTHWPYAAQPHTWFDLVLFFSFLFLCLFWSESDALSRCYIWERYIWHHKDLWRWGARG